MGFNFYSRTIFFNPGRRFVRIRLHKIRPELKDDHGFILVKIRGDTQRKINNIYNVKRQTIDPRKKN